MKWQAKERKLLSIVKSFGGGMLGLAGILLVVFVPLVLVFGTITISTKVYPFLLWLTDIFTIVSILIFLPLSIFKKTKGLSAIGLLVSSYVFGATVWVSGLFATIYTLGTWGVVVGLLLGIVGVVPLGMIGLLFHSEWLRFFDLLYGIILTYGSRSLSIYFAEKTQKNIIADSHMEYDERED